MMFRLLNILWEYVIPIMIPYFIYFLSTEMQLKFEVIPEEYTFDMNIAIYSSILVVAGKLLNNQIKKQKDKYSNISVLASNDSKNFFYRDIELFFRSDFAKLFFQIKLKGEPDKLKKKEVSIFFPPQVYVQLTKKSERYCYLDVECNCVRIDASKLFNANKTELILYDSATFDIEIIKIDEFIESSVEISLTKGKKMTALEKNKINLKK